MYLSKKFLIEQYVTLNKDMNIIAKEIGCCSATIERYIKKFDIKRENKYINNKFGKLLVLNKYDNDKNGHERYFCLCDCGNNSISRGYSLLSGNTKSCGCGMKRLTGKNHKQWKGYEKIYGNSWSNIIRGAKKRNIEFSIDIKYGWNLFVQQQEKCALTGILLRFSHSSEEKQMTASLDRIDSSKGYIEGNVQWVHKIVNMMKQALNNENFISICKLVSKNHFIYNDNIVSLLENNQLKVFDATRTN